MVEISVAPAFGQIDVRKYIREQRRSSRLNTKQLYNLMNPASPSNSALMITLFAVTRAYGSTGCRVFKRGVQNWKDFCLKINIPKGNY